MEPTKAKRQNDGLFSSKQNEYSASSPTGVIKED